MDKPKYRSALIVGTGPGLSASLARLFAKNGLSVAIAARAVAERRVSPRRAISPM